VIKPPEQVDATQAQLDELLALAQPTFPAPQYELLKQVLTTFVFVMQALQNAKTSLAVSGCEERRINGAQRWRRKPEYLSRQKKGL
jgi:hypothetical protein